MSTPGEWVAPLAPNGNSLPQQEAIHGLKRLGSIVYILCFLFLFNACFGYVGSLFIELTVTEWFVDWHTFFVAIAVLLGIATWPLSFWAFKRNIIGSTYGVFFAIVGVLLVAFLALVVWILVEWFLFCPTDMPDICTDTATATIELGWLLFASYSIIELILYAISFAVMYSVQKYYRRLMSSFSGMTQQQIVEMIYNSMFTDTPAYVTGIGMPMRQF